MVNKLLITILLVLLAAPAGAFQVLRGSTAAGGEGGDWYYSGTGTTTPPTWNSAYDTYSPVINGSTITTLSGLTISKIGARISAIDDQTQCKIILYNAALAPIQSVAITAATGVFLDVDITPYAVTGTIRIAIGCNGSGWYSCSSSTATNNGFNSVQTSYTNTPDNPLVINDTSNTIAVRAYVAD